MRINFQYILLLLIVAQFQSYLLRTFKKSMLVQSKLDDDEDNNHEIEDAIGAPVGVLPKISSKVNFGDQTPKNIKYGFNTLNTT